MPDNWLPLTHVKQWRPGACLPACARMVLLTLGDDASEDQLAQLFDTEWYGTPASRIQRLTPDTVIIHDPARDTGPDTINLDAFLLAWSEMDYYCAAITRA